jgi:hypothetical protein
MTKLVIKAVKTMFRDNKEKNVAGYDSLVDKLKGDPDVDNPYALAHYIKGESKKKGATQANTLNTLSQLLKKGTKLRCSESAKFVEKVSVSEAPEGHVFKVVLITEGLGNRRNMNFYGPEAIVSAPGIFEGKPCFLDHPSESEDRDIPERRVRDKCGYFKNVKVESMDGAQAVTGELHFDLSDSGKNGYLKALTALHYRNEFPNLESEYVGLSINADGEWEDRKVEWLGEILDVNYVTQFKDAFSCDIVTSPARGGRFLALVESAAGAKPGKEGNAMKGLKKSLEAARAALEEAVKESDAAKKASKVAEAKKLFDAFLKEAETAAMQDEDESESEKKEGCEDEGEAKVVAKASEKKEDEAKKEDESESEDDSEKKDKEVPAVKKEETEAEDDKELPKGDKVDGEDEDEDETVESKRLAVTALLKEAKVDLPEEKVAELGKLSLKEAKKEIAFLKGLVEATAKKVISKMSVPSARFASMSESERKAVGSGNNDLFADCLR